MSRTFTAASASQFNFNTNTINNNARDNDNEPSWMSRVKKVKRGEDIVINRDDEDFMEKGSAVLVSEGVLDREKAGSGSGTAEGDVDEEKKVGTTSGSKSSISTSASLDGTHIMTELETRVTRNENRERENEEHPIKNYLGDRAERESQDVAEAEVEGRAKDTRYCASDETSEWIEGHHVRSLFLCRFPFLPLCDLTDLKRL